MSQRYPRPTDYTFWVEIDGIPAKKYAEVTTGRTTSCYIASEANKAFRIGVSIDEDIRTEFLAMCHLNGIEVHRVILQPGDEEYLLESLMDKDGRERSLTFAKMGVVEDEEHIKRPPVLGVIEISLKRVTYKPLSRAQGTRLRDDAIEVYCDPFLWEQQFVYEREKADGYDTISLGQEVEVDERVNIDSRDRKVLVECYMEEDRKVWHSYKFQYRPLAELIAAHIIPLHPQENTPIPYMTRQRRMLLDRDNNRNVENNNDIQGGSPAVSDSVSSSADVELIDSPHSDNSSAQKQQPSEIKEENRTPDRRQPEPIAEFIIDSDDEIVEVIKEPKPEDDPELERIEENIKHLRKLRNEILLAKGKFKGLPLGHSAIKSDDTSPGIPRASKGPVFKHERDRESPVISRKRKDAFKPTDKPDFSMSKRSKT